MTLSEGHQETPEQVGGQGGCACMEPDPFCGMGIHAPSRTQAQEAPCVAPRVPSGEGSVGTGPSRGQVEHSFSHKRIQV